MKNNIYKEISTTNSRNKKYELKSKLTSLADNAKNGINKNKFLRELISFQKNQISQNKEKFLKYSTFKLVSKTPQELLTSIKKEITTNNTNIKSQNEEIKRLIKALKIKYEAIYSKGREVTEYLLNELDSAKEKNFLIKNATKRKDNVNLDITNNIIMVRAEGNNLDVDTTIYYEKELEDEIDIKDELKKSLEYFTLLYDQKLMQINKYGKDIKKRTKKINILKTNRKGLKKYVKTLNNLVTNFDYLSFPEGRNIVIEGEEFLLEQNDNVEDNNINNNGLSFLTEESESIILNETDNNILDIKEFDLLRNIYLEDQTKITTNNTVPKLDLTLINFNKQKLNYDYDEKSLSRNDMKEHSLVSLRIIKLKENIKILNDKNAKLLEKIKKYSQKINKLNNLIINMNYQNPNSFRIKSVKKRKFLFSSEAALTNASSRNAKSLSYRVDISRNKKKLNLKENI